MIMVDKLIFSDDVKTRSGFTILGTNIFCENGFFSESGIIENIAQTAALRMGFLYYLKKQPAPPGYIGAIKNLSIHSLPSVHENIETEILVLQEIFGVTLISATVWSGNNLLAECEMKTVIKKAD